MLVFFKKILKSCYQRKKKGMGTQENAYIYMGIYACVIYVSMIKYTRLRDEMSARCRGLIK
jgi:hypothetical protein